MAISIGGVGCSLIDFLFTGIDFKGPAFTRYLSKNPGDGGLVPGALVFAEDLEKFARRDYQEVLREITGGAGEASSNLGGPSVVALVHAAQMLAPQGIPVAYYGIRGDDETGTRLAEILSRTPLTWDHYPAVPGRTPVTYALSDPDYDDGAGERSFINSIAVAGTFSAADIPDEFFTHPIAAFGGTALVPTLHAELHVPITRARRAGALTVVNTVYDFLNQSRAPDKPWPVGNSPVTYGATDLLLVDAEEARRLSGVSDLRRAIRWFLDAGVSAVVITRGPEPVLATSRGGRFAKLPLQEFPVSRKVTEDLARGVRPRGDTTGCGDNFVGGVLASLAEQMDASPREIDLREAISWGIAAGGFACFSLGGTYLEPHPGEKRGAVEQYYHAYHRQLMETV